MGFSYFLYLYSGRVPPDMTLEDSTDQAALTRCRLRTGCSVRFGHVQEKKEYIVSGTLAVF